MSNVPLFADARSLVTDVPKYAVAAVVRATDT